MGTTYRFQCPSCKYEAEVSGKRDRGFYAVTETVVCNDCKSLMDIVVRYLDDPDDSMRKNFFYSCYGDDMDVDIELLQELRKPNGSGEQYMRLFVDRVISAFKMVADAENPFFSTLKKGFCPICDSESASVRDDWNEDCLVWDDLCPECQSNQKGHFRTDAFTYFYMIKKAEKKGINQRSGHCPICGQKMDKDAENIHWNTRKGTYPCAECFKRMKLIQKDLYKAISLLKSCRLCGSKHLVKWPSHGSFKCPKCGEEMLAGALVQLWD